MGQRRTETDSQVTSFPWCAKAVTPHATNPLTNYAGETQAQTVRVGTGGDVVYIPLGNDDDQSVTETFADGEIIPCLVRKVLASGTTATDLMGYF